MSGGLYIGAPPHLRPHIRAPICTQLPPSPTHTTPTPLHTPVSGQTNGTPVYRRTASLDAQRPPKWPNTRGKGVPKHHLHQGRGRGSQNATSLLPHHLVVLAASPQARLRASPKKPTRFIHSPPKKPTRFIHSRTALPICSWVSCVSAGPSRATLVTTPSRSTSPVAPAGPCPQCSAG